MMSNWPERATNDLAPFGLVPADLLDAESRSVIGISGALSELLTAKECYLSKVLAGRYIAETLEAKGTDLKSMLKLILEYTEGTPVNREVPRDTESEEVRVIEIVQRAESYSVAE